MNTGALLAGLALLAGNGFFVAAEFALLASRRSRIEQLAEEGRGAARAASRSLRELSLMLAGAQLGITVCSFGLGAVAEPAVEHGLEELLGLTPLPSAVSHALAFALALAIVVFLHMVVGEMAPKSWAISNPEGAALLLVRPFRAFVVVLKPAITLLNWGANLVVRACGVEPQDERALVHNAGDLALLVHEAARQGDLGGEHRAVLARALDLTGLDAESAMIPRAEIVAVPEDATIDEIEELAQRTGRSRLPVYAGELDRIRGVVHVKDVLGVPDDQRATRCARDLARPALVVPESLPLQDLMLQMREQRQHIALVVDEYGAITGLVALEDLIEEIIGDFEDETDQRRSGIRPRRDGSVLVAGTVRPDQLRARLDLELPDGEWETVAGYVIATLGRLPEEGDSVGVGSGVLTVARMHENRVVQLVYRPGVANPEQASQAEHADRADRAEQADRADR